MDVDVHMRLFDTAYHGVDDESVGALLDQGADINHRFAFYSDCTPLQIAILHGNTSTLKLLLEWGANANLTEETGNKKSPLSFSVCGRHDSLEMTQALVSHGADIEYRDNHGNTPLIDGAMYGKLASCKFLLSKGADLRAVNDRGESALTVYGCDADSPFSPARIAFHRAALETAFADGPHPTQVARRNWERRRWLLQVTAENGYRPLLHRLLAEKAAIVSLDPAAAIPAIEIDTPAKRHAHLLGQVLSNEGIHRLIVRML